MPLLAKCLKRDKTFSDFHETVRKTDARLHQLGLEDLLIMPVQRICKYPLLFRELAKTLIDFDELEQVQDLGTKFESVAQHVNESRREFENNRMVLKIQHSVEGLAQRLFGTKKRTFLIQLSLHIDANDIRRTLFLFDDLLLITARKPVVGRGKKYELKKLFSLDDCITFHNIDPTKAFANPIELVDSNGPEPLIYTLGFSSPEEKNKFYEALSATEAIREDFRGSDHRLPLTPVPPSAYTFEEFDLNELHRKLLLKQAMPTGTFVRNPDLALAGARNSQQLGSSSQEAPRSEEHTS